jgi:hypothetical protein
MFAYEFNSVVNDNAILIPEKYRGLISSNMRVIVLGEETGKGKKSVEFSALKLHTKGVKFE